MDVKKINSFHTFIESDCNYKKSAELCNITVPGLRKQLSSLEEELDTKLFETIGKVTKPTRKAHILYEKTHRILNDYTDIMHYFDNNSSSIEQPLIIRTSIATASLWICDHLKDFLDNYPDSNITIQASDTKPDLLKDKVDVYIGSKLSDPKHFLNQHQIQTFTMGLYASQGYVDNYGLPKTAGDLANHKIIGFGSEMTRSYQEVDWHLELTDPHLIPYFKINSGSGLLRSVELGLGIGAISNIGAKLAHTNLIHVLPEIKGYDVPVFFSYPRFIENDIRIVKILESLEEKKRNSSK
jgi:DNA-binding transcriptional LysR family regulator